MQPVPGNQRPDLLTSLMNISCTVPATENASLQILFNVPRLSSFLEMLPNPHVLLTFDKVRHPLRLPRETTSQRPKVARTCRVFHILTSKCASRHNGAHFFDISTSKSGPRMVCFVHFDFEMCFAPQRRALFDISNSKSGPRMVCFVHFDFEMCFAPTTACTFWTSQLPKVLRTWGVFSFFTCKCASRHNGVHFFDISTSKSGPRMVCFVHFDFEMCFAPQRRALFDISNSKSGPRMVCFVHFDFEMCFAPTTACTFWTSQLPKVLRTWGVFSFFTCKCASRHNGVHFFDISTSKSGPELVCFVHFDFEMCFAPQRRAIFHLSSGQMAPHPPL